VQQDRRRTPRYPFVATAEVIDESTKTSISTRVSELSLYGCYLDVAQPLERGTEILVKINSEGRYFEGRGKVVYAVPNQGVGVCFHDVRHQFVVVLKEWLIKAAQAKYGKQPAIE
jgi:PilZ domain